MGKHIEWVKCGGKPEKGAYGYIGDVCCFRLYRNDDKLELDVGLPNALPNLYGRWVERCDSAKEAATKAESIADAWLKRLKSPRKQK